MVQENFELGIDITISESSLDDMANKILQRLQEAASMSVPVGKPAGGAAPRAPARRREPPVSSATLASAAGTVAVNSRTFAKEFAQAVEVQNDKLIKTIERSNQVLVRAINQLLAATATGANVATRAQRETTETLAAAPPGAVRVGGRTDPQATRRRQVEATAGPTGRGQAQTNLVRVETGGRVPSAGVPVRPETGQSGVPAIDKGPARGAREADAERRAKELNSALRDLTGALTQGNLGQLSNILANLAIPKATAIGAGVRVERPGARITEVSRRTIEMGKGAGGGLEIKDIYDTTERAIRKRLSDPDFIQKARKMEEKSRFGDPDKVIAILRREVKDLLTGMPSVEPGGAMREAASAGEAVLKIDLTGQQAILDELKRYGRDEVKQIGVLQRVISEFVVANKEALRARGIEQIALTGVPEERAARSRLIYDEDRNITGARLNVQLLDLGKRLPGGVGSSRPSRLAGTQQAMTLMTGTVPEVTSAEQRRAIEAGEIKPQVSQMLKAVLTSQDIVPELHEDQVLVDYKTLGLFKSEQERVTQTMAQAKKGLEPGMALKHGDVIGYEVPTEPGGKGKPITFDLKGARAVIEEIEEIVEQGTTAYRIKFKELFELGTGGKLETWSHHKGVPRAVDLEKMGFGKDVDIVMSAAGMARRGDIGAPIEMMSTAIADELNKTGDVRVEAQEIRDEIVDYLRNVKNDIAEATQKVAAGRGLLDFTGSEELPAGSPLRKGGLERVITGRLSMLRLPDPREPGPGKIGTPYLSPTDLAALENRPETQAWVEEARERMERVGGPTREYIALLDSVANKTDKAASGLEVLFPEEFNKIPATAAEFHQLAGTILDAGKQAEAFALAIPDPDAPGQQRMLAIPGMGEHLGGRRAYRLGTGRQAPTELTGLLGRIIQRSAEIRAEEGVIKPGAVATPALVQARAFRQTKNTVENLINAIVEGLKSGQPEATAAAKAFLDRFRPMIEQYSEQLPAIQWQEKGPGGALGAIKTARRRGAAYLEEQTAFGLKKEGSYERGLLTLRDFLVGRTTREDPRTRNIATAGLLETNMEALASSMGMLNVQVVRDEETLARMRDTLREDIARLKELAAIEMGVRVGSTRDPAALPYMARAAGGLALSPTQLTALQIRRDMGAEFKKAGDVLAELAREGGGPGVAEAQASLERMKALQKTAPGGVTLPAGSIMINRKDWEQQVQAIRAERAAVGEEIVPEEAERRARYALMHRWPTTGEASYQPVKVEVSPDDLIVPPGKMAVAGPYAGAPEDIARTQKALEAAQEGISGKLGRLDPASEEAIRLRAQLGRVNEALDGLIRSTIHASTNLDHDGDMAQVEAAASEDAARGLRKLYESSMKAGDIGDRALMTSIKGEVKPAGTPQTIADYRDLLEATRKGGVKSAGLMNLTPEVMAQEAESLIGAKKMIGMVTDQFNRVAMIAGSAGEATSAFANTLGALMLNINEPLAMKGGRGASAAGPMQLIEDFQSFDMDRVMSNLEKGEGSYKDLLETNEKFRKRRGAALLAKEPEELAAYARERGVSEADIAKLAPKPADLVNRILDLTDIKAGLRQMMENLRKTITKTIQESTGWNFVDASRELDRRIAAAQAEVKKSGGKLPLRRAMMDQGISFENAAEAIAPEWTAMRKAAVAAAREDPERAMQSILAHARSRAGASIGPVLEAGAAGEYPVVEVARGAAGGPSPDDIAAAKQLAGMAAARGRAMVSAALETFGTMTQEQVARRRGQTVEEIKRLRGFYTPAGAPGGGPPEGVGRGYLVKERTVDPTLRALAFLEKAARGDVDDLENFGDHVQKAADVIRQFGETVSHEMVHMGARATGPGKRITADIERALMAGGAGPLAGQQGKIFEAMKQWSKTTGTQAEIERAEARYRKMAPSARIRAEEWEEPARGFGGTAGEFMALSKAERAQYLLSQHKAVRGRWRLEAPSMAQELLAHQTTDVGAGQQARLKQAGVSREAIGYLESQFGKFRTDVSDSVRDQAEMSGRAVWEALQSGSLEGLARSKAQGIAEVEAEAVKAGQVAVGGVPRAVPAGAVQVLQTGPRGAAAAESVADGGGPAGGGAGGGGGDGDDEDWIKALGRKIVDPEAQKTGLQVFLGQLEAVLLATQRARGLQGMEVEPTTGRYRFPGEGAEMPLPEEIKKVRLAAPEIQGLIRRAKAGEITEPGDVEEARRTMLAQVRLVRKKYKGLVGKGAGKISSGALDAAIGSVLSEFNSGITAQLINQARKAEQEVAALVEKGEEPAGQKMRSAIRTLDDAVARVQDFIEQTMEPTGRGRGRVLGGIGISQRAELSPEAVAAGLSPSRKAVKEMIKGVAGYSEEGTRWLGKYENMIELVVAALKQGVNYTDIWSAIWQELKAEPKMMGHNMKKLSEIFLKLASMNVIPEGQFTEAAQGLEAIGKGARDMAKGLEGVDTSTLDLLERAVSGAPKRVGGLAARGEAVETLPSVEAQYKSIVRQGESYRRDLERLIKTPGYEKMGKPRYFQPITKDIVDPKTQKVIQKITISAKRMGKQIRMSFEEGGAGAQHMGRQLRSAFRRVVQWGFASGIVYGTIRAFRQASQVLTEVQDKMMALKKVMDTSITDFDKLENTAVRFAKQFGIGIGEVLDGMVVYGQQGLKMNEITDRTRATLLAVNTTTLTAVEATEALTAAHKVFGDAVSNSEGYVDAWGAVAARHAITAKDLADAVKRSGAAAKTAGIGFEDFLGMVTAIGAVTRQSGKEIATSTKFMARAMRRPTAQKQLLSLGVASKTMQGDLRPAMDILTEVADKWGDLSRAQQLATAQAMAGIRHYNSFIVLMENFKEQQLAAIDASNSQGFAVRKNVLAMQTFHKQMGRLRESVNALVISTGKTLLPTLTKLVSFFSAAINIVGKLPDTFKLTGVAIAGLIVSFTKLGDVVLDSMEAFSGRGLVEGIREEGIGRAMMRKGKGWGSSLASGITSIFAGGGLYKGLGKSMKAAFTLPTAPADSTRAFVTTFKKDAPLLAKGIYSARAATMSWISSLGLLKSALMAIGITAVIAGLIYLGKTWLDVKAKGDAVADALFDQIGKSQDLSRQYQNQARQVAVLGTAYQRFEKALAVFKDPAKFQRAVSEKTFKGPLTALREYEQTVADVHLAMARLDPSLVEGISESGDYIIHMGAGFEEMSTSAADAQRAITAALQVDVLKAYVNELKNATNWWDSLKEKMGLGAQGPLSQLKEVRKVMRELSTEGQKSGYAALGAQAAMVGKVSDELELRGKVAELAIKTKKILDEMPAFENIDLGRTILNAAEMRQAIETSVEAGAFGRGATAGSVMLSALGRSAGLGGVLTPTTAADAGLQMEAVLERGIQGRAVGAGGLAGVGAEAAMLLPREVAKGLLEVTNNTRDLGDAFGDLNVDEAVRAAQTGFSTIDKEGKLLFNYFDLKSGALATVLVTELQQVLDETGQKIAVMDHAAIKAAADRTQKFLTMQYKGVLAGIRDAGQVDLGPGTFRQLTAAQRVMRELPEDMQSLVRIQEQFSAVIKKFNEDISGVDEEGLKDAAFVMSTSSNKLEILERDTIEMLLGIMKEGFNLTVLGHYQTAMEELNKTMEDAAHSLRELSEEERDRFELLTHTAGALAGRGVMPNVDFGKQLRELTGAERLQLEVPGFGAGMVGLGIAGKQRDVQFEQLRNIKKQRTAFEEMVADLRKAGEKLTEEEAEKRLELAATGDKEFAQLGSTIIESSLGIQQRVEEQTPVLHSMLGVLTEMRDISSMPEKEKRRLFKERTATASLGKLYDALGAGRGGAARSQQFLKRVAGIRSWRAEERGFWTDLRRETFGGEKYVTAKGMETPFKFESKKSEEAFERQRENLVSAINQLAAHQELQAKKLADEVDPRKRRGIKKESAPYIAEYEAKIAGAIAEMGKIPEIAEQLPKWATEYITGFVSSKKVPEETPEDKLAKLRERIEEKRTEVLSSFAKAELETIAGIKDASSQMSEVAKKARIAVHIRDFGIALDNLVNDFKKAEALAYEKEGSVLEGAFAKVGKPGFKTDFERREEEIQKKYGRGLVSGEDLRARAKEMADLEYDKKEARIKQQQDKEVAALRLQQQQAERVRETIAGALFGGELEDTGLERTARNYMDTLTKQLSESEQATMRGGKLKFKGIPALEALKSFAAKIKESAKAKAQEALIATHRQGQQPTVDSINSVRAAMEVNNQKTDAMISATTAGSAAVVKAIQDQGALTREQTAAVQAAPGGAPAVAAPAVAARVPLDLMKSLDAVGQTFNLQGEKFAPDAALAAVAKSAGPAAMAPGLPFTAEEQMYNKAHFARAGLVKGGQFVPDVTQPQWDTGLFRRSVLGGPPGYLQKKRFVEEGIVAGTPGPAPAEPQTGFTTRERMATLFGVGAKSPATQIFSPTGILPKEGPLAFGDQPGVRDMSGLYGGLSNYNLVKEAQDKRASGNATSTGTDLRSVDGETPGVAEPARKPETKEDAAAEATSELGDKLDALTEAVLNITTKGIPLPEDLTSAVENVGDTVATALGSTLKVEFDGAQTVNLTAADLDALGNKLAKVAPVGADVPTNLSVRLELLEKTVDPSAADINSRISRAVKDASDSAEKALASLGTKLGVIETEQKKSKERLDVVQTVAQTAIARLNNNG